MTGGKPLALAGRLALAAALALLLGGCAYDYLQHTDRVAYSAGDAVKANLEAQTVNPTDASRYDTRGLGRDGALLLPQQPLPAAPPAP